MSNFFSSITKKRVGLSTLFCLTLVVILFGSCSEANKLTLSKGGKALYDIVLPDVPSPIETTAAKELKQHLDAITGANFVIVNESAANNEKSQIVVGNSKRAYNLLPSVDVDKLAYDGVIIETIGKNIILLGHPVRGTLYAVNTFLEDGCGVRWWTSTESTIPSLKTLKVPIMNINYAPDLIYREAFYKDAYSSDVNFRTDEYKDISDVFDARMKCNGFFANIRPEYGGYHKFQYFVHSFYQIVSPNLYFEKHPEWFSLIKGKRTKDWAQLCLTNEKMKEEFIKNALDTLRLHPDMDFISVSQNDCHGPCQCDECQSIVKEEGSESGPLIRFVNDVAEAIEKEFPDIWIETLAYQYTRKAPLKVKPRKNVVVRLCTIECSFSQPLGEGAHNQPLREDIEAWSKIADHLFVWNYVTNFSSYMLPHPNIHTLAHDIRFFIKNHTIGLFEQGDVYCDAGDFVRMRNWIISHLMWNPDLDENKLIDEFLTGYYGKDAASCLRQYWDLLTEQCKSSDVYLRCYMQHTADWLTIPVYAKADSLMKQAIAVTKDEVLIKRLKREYIPLKYVLLLENERFREYEKQNGTQPFSIKDPEAALTEFLTLLKENNVKMIHEDFSEKPNHIAGMEQNLRNKLFSKRE